MELVVDTNILISALIKDSLTRKIILHLEAKFFSPRFLEEEIAKYKQDILRKGNLNEAEFRLLFENLKSKLIFLSDELVQLKYNQAAQVMDQIDWKDTLFIAAAMAVNADIWSDDKHFEKQDKVRVWKTKDLVEFV